MPADLTGAPWQRLTGHFSAAVLVAPHTPADLASGQLWPPGYAARLTAYLTGNVAGQPWGDTLVLLAAVLTARRLDLATIVGQLSILHARFHALFPAFGLTTLADWHVAEHLPAYLRRTVLPDDTPQQRAGFTKIYCSTAEHLARWHAGLPAADQARYALWLLPPTDGVTMRALAQTRTVRLQQRLARKLETEAVVPQLAEIRLQAHLRYNRLARLRQQVTAVHAQVAPDRANLPLAFAYDEGGDPAHGVPAQERLHFRLWDRGSFIQAHRAAFADGTFYRVRAQQRGGTDTQHGFFLEFVRAERLHDAAPPQGLWFADLIRQQVLGNNPLNSTPAGNAARRAWLRGWGYGLTDDCTCPFDTDIPGLLAQPKASGDGRFLANAQLHTEGLLFTLDPYYTAAVFGLLAVNIFTTTGMRINELLQIRLSPDCLVQLVFPAPPDARDQTARRRTLLRLIPKGERSDMPHDYFIGAETVRLLRLVGELLQAHYALGADAGLPAVPFSPRNPRAHRFGPAPYLFQYQRKHFADQTVMACVRFLLHGMIFTTREGQPVVLKAHLLRHAFATYAVQVEKIPVDIVGAWLQQKNLLVTEYYSAPGPGQIAEAADRYLARIAAQIDVAEAVLRSPAELRRQYEEARGQAGTLTEVPGGTCTQHGFCAAKFACIGCAAKVPDPDKRPQVRHKQFWALQQVDYAVQEGLLAEAERMRQLARDCALEEQEMDQIEAYRRDAAQTPPLQIEAAPVNKPTSNGES